MPLVFLSYVALLVGCALGGADRRPVVGALLVATAVGVLRRSDLRVLGAALAFCAGVLLAVGEERAVAACRGAALATGRVDVVLDGDVRPGGRATGSADGCTLPVSLGIARGRAAAGDVVRAAGEAVPTTRGVQLRDASIEPLGRSSRLGAWRAIAARRIDALFGEDAPLVRALVVADVSDVDPSVRDRYADAGLVHLLSVSGLHVSIVAESVVLLLGACRVGRRRADVIAVGATALYVFTIGAPAPAVRAGTMLAAQLASRALQRPTSPWAVLALGGTIPLLVAPGNALDVGYLLSMAGMAALVAGRALARRLDVAALGGWRTTLARELVISVVATVVTAPIVAWCFGRVSAVGPIANLAAAPIVAVLQPTLFLAVLLSPVSPLANHVAGAARLLLAGLDQVASAAASVPLASLSVAPTGVVAVVSVAASVALVVACVARDGFVRRRAAVVGAAATVAIVVLPLAPQHGAGALELHMLDVGQGDAIALRTPHGHWVLVDAGRAWGGGDGGRATVVPYVRRRGGPVDAFVLSHPHADHVGGAATVLRALRPAHYWDAAFALGSDVYRGSLVAAREAGVAWHRVRPDDSLVVDGVTLRVLAPDSAWTAALADANLASVIVSVAWRGVRFLLVGDAEAPEERWLVDRVRRDDRLAAELRADVLKVAHHGSRTSSTPEFLALVRPRIALVSVGAGNTYRLPNDDVLDRLARGGAQVLRTDQLGAIIVRADGTRLTINAGGESWSVPPRAEPDSSKRSSGGV